MGWPNSSIAIMPGLVKPFLGALQACVSVLLTMCYGVAARRLHLLHETTINDMLGLGMKLLLPALVVVHLGEQLHLGTAVNYIPVIIWSIFYTSASIGLAHGVSRILSLPQWVTPACTFNNTTSLPLLLIESLEGVGSLKLILRNDENMSSAIDRAQSYFLICGIISKTIAYIVGPKMLQDNSKDQDIPDEQDTASSVLQDDEHLSEQTSLLPQRAQTASKSAVNRIRGGTNWLGSFFPHRVKQRIMAPFEIPFADITILCTILGAILGLVPSLHRAFFFRQEDGGIFNAWLTASIRNIGGLFTTLQIFLVGCKLGVTFKRMVAGGNLGRIPVKAITALFVIRLLVWRKRLDCSVMILSFGLV